MLFCFRFAVGFDQMDRRHPAISRMKQMVNNNTAHVPEPTIKVPTSTTVVVQRGKKVRTSLRQHERQQDELFEL